MRETPLRIVSEANLIKLECSTGWVDLVLQPVTLGYRFTIFYLVENRSARYYSLSCCISRFAKVLDLCL